MADYDEYDNYDNYTYNNNYTAVEDNYTAVEEDKSNKSCFKEVMCATLVVVNVVIFLLGICGNALVIWIAGFKMKKTVITICYLSLAISDFIFCVCLPINITLMAMDNNWIFGHFVCKFAPFVMFLNMFSSIFLLVIISFDRCLTVVFPVWAQNNRTLRKASTAVVLAWVISIALSIPSLVFREIKFSPSKDTTKCFDNYDSHTHTTIVVSRLVSGFVLPMIMICPSYAIIIIRLRNNRMAKSSKPFKVMTALIAVFFISWLPYHVFKLIEIYFFRLPIHNGVRISATLASANSCLNPFLYAFMGKDFKRKFWSLLPMIENAFDEDLWQSDTSRKTSLKLLH